MIKSARGDFQHLREKIGEQWLDIGLRTEQ